LKRREPRKKTSGRKNKKKKDRKWDHFIERSAGGRASPTVRRHEGKDGGTSELFGGTSGGIKAVTAPRT